MDAFRYPYVHTAGASSVREITLLDGVDRAELVANFVIILESVVKRTIKRFVKMLLSCRDTALCKIVFFGDGALIPLTPTIHQQKRALHPAYLAIKKQRRPLQWCDEKNTC